MSPQLAAAKNAEDRIFRLSDDASEEEATRAIYVANKIDEKWHANLRNELSDIFVNNTSNLSTETVELGKKFATHEIVKKANNNKNNHDVNILPKDVNKFTKLHTSLLEKDPSGELSSMATELYAVGYTMKEIQDILGV